MTETDQGRPSRFCPNCGSAIEPGSSFCGSCGQRLEGVAPAQPAAAYVPPSVVAGPPSAPPAYAPPPAAEPAYAPPGPVGPAPSEQWAVPPAGSPPRKSGNRGCCLAAAIAGVLALLLAACGGVAFWYLAMQGQGATTPAAPSATRTAAAPTATATPTAARPAPTGTPVPTTAPVRTATPTRTSTPAPRATNTPTRQAGATATPQGILFQDDFGSRQSTMDNGWNLEAGANVEYVWSQGKLSIAVKKADWLGSTWPDGEWGDLAVEAEAQPAASSSGDYGIVFRVSGSSDLRSYYMFGVTTDGKYQLLAKVDGDWIAEDPVPPTASSAIKTGSGKNTLGVIAQGDRISLYINRSLVKTITDDLVPYDGYAGVYAGSNDPPKMTVAFTKFTVLTPAKAQSEWGGR